MQELNKLGIPGETSLGDQKGDGDDMGSPTLAVQTTHRTVISTRRLQKRSSLCSLVPPSPKANLWPEAPTCGPWAQTGKAEEH